MDAQYSHATGNFFSAVRSLATSSDTIQNRLIDAHDSVLAVTLDQFDGDIELKIKLARILDLMGVDRDGIEIAVVQNTAHMGDLEATKLAELICDFFYEL